MTNNNQKLVLGIATLALIVVAGVAYHFAPPAVVPSPDQDQTSDVGGQFYNNNPVTFDADLNFVQSVAALPGNNGNPSSYFGTLGLTMAAGSQISYVQNKTGSTIYVSNLALGYTGTASSTFRAYVFATTTSPTTLTNLYSLTALSEAINGANTFLTRGVIYATSTAATTTNSTVEAIANRGNGMIRVPNNGYFVVLLQAVDNANCPSTGLCEAATSTRRGFNPFWRVQYYR